MSTHSRTPATTSSDARITVVLACLFFLFATTWLFGPLVHGDEYGSLQFISTYEGRGQIWSWLFRSGDIISSVLLIVLAYRVRVWSKDRVMFLLLLAFAALAAVDAIFALNCKVGIPEHCIVQSGFSNHIHGQESYISVFVIAAAILWDVFRRRRIASIAFLFAQVAFIILTQVHLISQQQLIFLQYIYEVVLVIWLLYTLESFVPRLDISPHAARWYRHIMAYWVGASGILTIITAAAHLRLFDPSFVLYFGDRAPWVAPQGMFFGVLMLYLARQIYQGQRRAAYVLLGIVLFEIAKYSLAEPDPPLLALYLVTFIVLFVSRHTFRRNIGPLTVHKRILDLATVLGGVLASLAIISILLVAFGRFHHVTTAIASGRHFVSHHYGHHLRLEGERARTSLSVLLLSTLGISVWALFRPSGGVSSTTQAARDRQQARKLLEQMSDSSEDYFKLWPEDKHYFFAPEHQGFIAYKYVNGTAFALHGPIAADDTGRKQLMQQFNEFCTLRGWTVCFLAVDEASRQLYEPELNLLPIGSSALVDIGKFTQKTLHDKWWRWQNNRGTKRGLNYHRSMPPHSDALLDELQVVSDAWLTRPGHQEQGFALGYFDRQYLQKCTVHYLRDAEGRLIAFTNQLPTFKSTQTTVDLLRYLPDAQGAMPYLLLSTLKFIEQEGTFKTFDLGFVPLAHLTGRPAQLIKAISQIRFSAAGLEQFKGKFNPEWIPAYLAYSGDILDLAALAIKLETALRPPHHAVTGRRLPLLARQRRSSSSS